MTKLRHSKQKLGRLTWTETSGPMTVERDVMTKLGEAPTSPSATETERVVASWSLERCEQMVVKIKRKRGTNQRVWPVVTQETYAVLMRRIGLLRRGW